MKNFLVLTIALFATTFSVLPVNAAGQSNCQIVYGGGEVCEDQVKFTINKLVQKPGKGGGDFVDNLTVNDPRFAPNQNVNFKIVIENTGNKDITNLNVVDSFPNFLSFVSGVGNSREGDKTVNFTVGRINRGQRTEFVITAKTGPESAMGNQAISCVVNNVKATSPDGSVAEDNAQICVERAVISVPAPQVFQKPQVSQIPATGPELGYLAALIPTGLAGIFLKRKAR